MREIELTKGQVAIVSEDKYDDLTRHRWCATWNKTTRSFYATRRGRDKTGKMTLILMHRQILDLHSGDKRTGDHINRNTLDSRNENLRIASHAQNCWNQRLRSSNTSGFRGVRKNHNKGFHDWTANIRVNGKSIYLGRRPTAEMAYHELYVPAAKLHFGEFSGVR